MLSDEELIKTFSSAVQLENMAFIVREFFSDGNEKFHRAMKQAYMAKTRNLISEENIRTLEKNDKGPVLYSKPRYEWIENVGNIEILREIGNEMNRIRKSIQPSVQELLREAYQQKKILEKISIDYENHKGFGDPPKEAYAEMLTGKEISSLTVMSNGLFGGHVKFLCINKAEKKGLCLPEFQEFGFYESVKKDYEIRAKRAKRLK